MKIIESGLEGCKVLELNLFGDDRGFFLESFNQETLTRVLGYPFEIKQVNQAKSSKNVLRGLHFQIPPKAQTKLVGVSAGAVVDVVVDLRKSSPTFGNHFIQKLDRPNLLMVVPAGFAHGYYTLEEGTQFFYYVDDFYSPEHEQGLMYNDPELAIGWPLIDDPVVSAKDLKQPNFKDLKPYFD